MTSSTLNHTKAIQEAIAIYQPSKSYIVTKHGLYPALCKTVFPLTPGELHLSNTKYNPCSVLSSLWKIAQ